MAYLLIHSVDGESRKWELDSDLLVIGSNADCDMTLEGQCVSNRHAEIHCSNDLFRLRDLNSTNGTRVNGKLIVEHQLEEGDCILFGTQKCTFHSGCIEKRSGKWAQLLNFLKGLERRPTQTLTKEERTIIACCCVLVTVGALGVLFPSVSHYFSDARKIREMAGRAQAEAERERWVTNITNLPKEPMQIGDDVISAIDLKGPGLGLYEPLADFLGEFAIKRRRATSTKGFPDPTNEFALHYTLGTKLVLDLDEGYTGAYMDNGPDGLEVKEPWTIMKGRLDHIEIAVEELPKFAAICQKYDEWRKISSRKKLVSGVEKELGDFGGKIYFITPDKMEMNTFILEPPDVQIIADMLSEIPAMRTKIIESVKQAAEARKSAEQAAKAEREADQKARERADQLLK